MFINELGFLIHFFAFGSSVWTKAPFRDCLELPGINAGLFYFLGGLGLIITAFKLWELVNKIKKDFLKVLCNSKFFIFVLLFRMRMENRGAFFSGEYFEK